MSMIETAEKTFSFADFEVDTAKRLLLKNGRPVTLNPKAFDLLTVLVKNHEQILSKDELLETVWENQFVEENNLSVHISALRKIFDEKKGEHQFIVTVPGKGYKFVAKVTTVDFIEAEAAEGFSSAAQNYLQIAALESFGEGESLIGREREIAEIKNLLRLGGAGLVTLTGAGGSGKTRLARAVAGEFSAELSDGVFFIELAALTDPELVVPAIVKTLGLMEAGGQLLVDVLRNFLRERRILLVLDNFEQLLSAASVLKKLGDSSAHLKILVTSRAALKLPGEKEFVVTPLAVPPRETAFSVEKLAAFSAVRLFAARAQTARPDFVLTDENAPVIAEICQKLDGLPLAIELAAVRVRLLPVSDILKRLQNSLKLLTGGTRETPSRNRTMRGAIQWSYDLLDVGEKTLFRRLVVFAGGFTIAAAESVAGERSENGRPPAIDDGQPAIEFLDGITSLLDNNLLIWAKEPTDAEGRLRMLEVVREFAGECLEENGEAETVRDNHARYFLALAEEAESHLTGKSSVEWLERLETEHDNIRTVLRWSLENDIEAGARAAAALRYFWINHVHYTEGRSWLETFLQRSGRNYSDICFKLLHGAGQFARCLGDFEFAGKIYEETLAASEKTNNREQTVIALHGLAAVAMRTGDFQAAQKLTEEQLAISRQLGDESKTVHALGSLGDILIAEGDLLAARPVLEESLEICEKLGNKHIKSINLLNLGAVDYGEADYQSAVSHFSGSMSIALELGNKSLISCCFDGFAAVAGACGEAEQAARLAGAAENLRESIGYQTEIVEQLFCDRYRAKIRAALDEKTFADAFEQGSALQLNEAIALAEDSASSINRQTTEIIVETHKFERIVINEEIETTEDPIAEINGREVKMINSASGSLRTPAVFAFLRSYFAVFIGAILVLAAIAGGYFWRQNGANFFQVTPFAQNNVRQLTTNGKVQIAVLSPDGKLFAYTTADLGQQSLWLGFTAGGNQLLLRPAADGTVYYELAFSPDASRLYFSAKTEAGSNLYKMPVFGGAAEKISDDVGSFSLSPDGGQLAFSRAEAKKETIFIANLDGSNERGVLTFPRERLSGVIADTISWSPDGKRLAFRDADENAPLTYDLVTLEIANGKTERIKSKAWRDVLKTAWLKDGSGLIVSAVAADSWASVIQYRLMHVELPGGKTRAITTDRSSYDSLSLSAESDLLLSIEHRQVNNVWLAPTEDLSAARQITFSSFGKYAGLWGLDFTPDGRIIYTNSDTQSQFISQMNADGSEQKPLTAPGLIDSVLNVSADGRYVVFHSNRSGGFDIWRMDANGSNLKQLTFGKLNFQPFVSADNRWVYYKSWENGTGELRRVSVDGGEPEILNDKETSWVSFSPDGRYFAGSYRTDKLRLAIFSAATNEVVKQFELPKTGTLEMGSHWTGDSRAVVYRDNAYGYWRQPVEDGGPVRLEGLPKEKFYNFSISKDGKWFAFVGGQEIRDVILFQTNSK